MTNKDEYNSYIYKWSKSCDIMLHRRQARIVCLYSLDGASVHSVTPLQSAGSCSPKMPFSLGELAELLNE